MKVDQLPVLLSSPALEFEKLLAVPKLPSSSGAAMAKAIVEIIQEWKLEDRVEALSFDTTASNTGIHSGCCQLLGEALGRPLLHLACRHHIMELILAAVFKAEMVASSGPDIPLFKRFREQWFCIPRAGFSVYVDPRLDEYRDWREAIIT